MTGAMATVTPLCQAPIVAEGFTVVMRRSASARPTSGLAWLSAKTSLSLAPQRRDTIPARPEQRAAGGDLHPAVDHVGGKLGADFAVLARPRGRAGERDDHADHDLLRRLGVDRHHPHR